MFGSFIRALAVALALFPPLAFAQSSPIPGFPPGVFSNKAALDPAPSGGSFSLTYESTGISSVTTLVVSYGSLSWGSGCNAILQGIQWYNTSSADSISSISIVGNSSPSQVSGVQTTNNNGNVTSDAWELVSPSGTSGVTAITYSQAPTFTSAIAVYCLVSAHTTPTATAHNSGFGTSISQSIVVPSGGAALVVASANAGTTITLTNAIVDSLVTTGGAYMVFGHTTITGTVTVTVTVASNDSLTLGLVAVGP